MLVNKMSTYSSHSLYTLASKRLWSSCFQLFLIEHKSLMFEVDISDIRCIAANFVAFKDFLKIVIDEEIKILLNIINYPTLNQTSQSPLPGW